MSNTTALEFTLVDGDYVDIRHHEKFCTSGKCYCLLPPEKASSNPRDSQADYLCEPVPSNKTPPVGPNMMMHFSLNPKCVSAKNTWILKQFPKKLCGKLVARYDAPVTGWGIYFKEGRDMRKFLCIVFANTLIIFIFGVIWAVLKEDI